MATLLGTANIQGAFTATCGDAIVQTFENRATTTAYRAPISAYRGIGIARDNTAALYNDEFAEYTTGQYFINTYVTEETDFVGPYVETATSPSNPGTSELLCHFNFLDIDHRATITSIEVQVTLKSTIGGYTTYPPYGTQDTLHYGKIKGDWFGSGPEASATDTGTFENITQNTAHTKTITLTPTALGTLPTLKLSFEGVVNPGDTYPGADSLNLTIYNVVARVNYTGKTRLTTGFRTVTSFDSIADGGDIGIDPVVTVTGYDFASHIPAGATVHGTQVKWGFVDYTATVGGSDPAVEPNKAIPSVDASQNTLRYRTSGGLVSTAYIDNIDNNQVYHLPTTTDTQPQIYYAWDNSNTLGVTRANAVDSTFGLQHEPGDNDVNLGFALTQSGLVQEADQEGISPQYETYAIDIAYIPALVSGDIAINTVTTVADTTVNITRTSPANISSAFTTQTGPAGLIYAGESTINSAFSMAIDSELSITAVALSFPSATVSASAQVEYQASADLSASFTTDFAGNITYRVDVGSGELPSFDSAFTLTALGGFKLLSAALTINSTTTTDVGLAGLIFDGASNINSAFGVTVSAINDISGTALSFPTATVTATAQVSQTAHSNINSTATVSMGLAGMIRTGFTVSPQGVFDFADTISTLIKPVVDTRVFVESTQTRTHRIPQQLRTQTIASQTRTHPIDAQVRTITVDTQTRTAPVEGM
jgi:hypothetical protein